jgi:hypothetical protein
MHTLTHSGGTIVHCSNLPYACTAACSQESAAINQSFGHQWFWLLMSQLRRNRFATALNQSAASAIAFIKLIYVFSELWFMGWQGLCRGFWAG